jgi:hypothetical protein
MKAVTPTLDCTGRSTSRWLRFLPQLFAQKSTSAPPVASSTVPVPWRPFASACLIVLLAVAATPARAVDYTIDDSTSPISATFTAGTGTSADGRISVKVKPDATPTWNQGTAGGGASFSGGSLQSQTATKIVWQNASINGVSLTVTVELVAPYSNGDLRVTLSNTSTAMPSGGIAYPYPFHTANGSGNAIVPVNSGYVVPTSDSSMPSKVSPIGTRRMEFCGGTDSSNSAAWVGIFETSDDVNLTMPTAGSTVSGSLFYGTGPIWSGSNNNASQTTNLLSYNRSIRYRFFTTGGYVAVAKHFRSFADSKGWVKTLAEKAADFPGTTETTNAVLKSIGAPIIYLWGDGRSTAMLDALKTAGVNKALIQFSVNHSNQSGTFDTSLFSYAQGKGYNVGIYDIYTTARTTGGGSPYDGFTYLWPNSTTAQSWAWVPTPGGSPEAAQGGSGWNICMTKQEQFALGTRLSARITDFGLDSEFYDVHCAQAPRECYHSGHFQSRTTDIAKRQAMLNDAYSGLANPSKRLLTGSEQARSWAVPYLIWGEGQQHLGQIDSQGTVSGSSEIGGWGGANGKSSNWPGIMVDMQNLSALNNGAEMNALMLDGYQAPLWDLVYHDCVLSTLHWERAQNHFLYVWDKADLSAILRGQTALLNLVYQGTGTSPTADAPAYVTDNIGLKWSTRWLDTVNDPGNRVKNRVLQTITNVAGWHAQVGLLEMTDHQWLTTDRTVQKAEFSANGGVSGYGVVVNFGTYNYANNKYGPASNSTSWTGSPHAGVAPITVSYPSATEPGFVKYSWSNNTPPTISNITDRTISKNGTTGAVAFTVGDAETAAGSLTVSGGSSNTTLVPVANIFFGGSGANRTVTVTPATGQTGTAMITVTVSDGSLTAQDTFLLTVNSTSTTVSFTSEGGNDGWLLENTPGSNTASTASNPVGGNSNNNGAGALRIGDDAGNRQFRSIVSFNVTGLPAGAVIESATLRFTRSAGAGNVSGFGTSFNAAIKGGSGFANSASLQWGATLNDFSNTSGPGGVGAPPDLAAAVTGLTVVGVGSPTTGTLTSGAVALLGNGRFQFRIDFPTKTVNTGSQDYVGFYSGENSTPSNRPVLSITYH